MKTLNKQQILLFLFLFTSHFVEGQPFSLTATFSPGANILYGADTRIGYHYNQWSTLYMRYNDSAYFCGIYLPAYWGGYVPSVPFYKIPFDNSFIINDFKPILSDQGLIGSYTGVGIFAHLFDYTLTLNPNYLPLSTFPEVNRLKRISFIQASHLGSVQIKAFAIGERDIITGSYHQSYLMEFIALGIGAIPAAPYRYAPMAFDSITRRQERVDDVITIDNYVVFATRDTRDSHEPVNLRISDTTSVLSNTDIDYQWRFRLDTAELVVGEIRLVPVSIKEFIMAYVILNTDINQYNLCIHRITLPDLLSNINTIVSHSLLIEKVSSNLVDMVFEPDVKTMVVLFNGYNESRIYHLDPFATVC